MELIEIIEWIISNLNASESVVGAVIVAFIGVLIIMKIFGINISTERNGNSTKEKMSDETRRHLYGENGTTKFVPRAQYEMETQACQKRIADHFKDIDKTMKEINRFMGRVDQFMESYVARND